MNIVKSPKFDRLKNSYEYRSEDSLVNLNFLNWNLLFFVSTVTQYIIVTARSSLFLIGKQKLGVTFNSDKLGGIDFTKFSKLSMCSAGAGWYNGLGFLLGTAHGQF